MDKVIAVIVTHNRQQLLSECVAALRAQTRKIDKILIINNGSTDSTHQWLKEQADIEFMNQDNLGSAGGFHMAIKMGYEQGYSWIWLMDDDGFPKSDALEKLLEEDDSQLSLRNCAIINKDDKKSFVWKTLHYKTLDEVKTRLIQNIAHPFNGTLMHRKIVERVGLPEARLFLWGDETEYYYRIVRKNAIPFYTVKDSIHYHPARGFTIKTDWTYSTGWKMYYYVRNRYFVLKSKFSKSALLASALYIGFLLVFSLSILIFQKSDKFKKLGFIFWPAIDALKARFDVTPAMILRRLA